MPRIDREQEEIAERFDRMGDTQDRPLLIVEAVAAVRTEVREGVSDRV
jgi:hypothetical protein